MSFVQTQKRYIYTQVIGSQTPARSPPKPGTPNLFSALLTDQTRPPSKWTRQIQKELEQTLLQCQKEVEALEKKQKKELKTEKK